MKVHTNDFKTNISSYGRDLNSILTYELNGETIELGNDDLNSISPHYKADILKSVMKQIDIDSNVDIPLQTELNYQFGVKVNGQYEYLDYGNYIVYSSEKQEDLRSYKIVAYDKMLYSMKDYESLGITYPITIRNYINAICTHLGLTFKNANDTFANYNRQIQSELYLDSQGNSMGYKFRDVLDELAQATGSTICIDNNDELEIRYITETHDTIEEEFFKDINVNFGEKYGPINSIVLSRSGGADNVYLKDDQSIAQNGLCEIKISDNQILNWNDRADYLPDLLSQLGGIEYYLNDYASTGIMYYDLCDRYTAKIGDKYYSCVMLNDEPIVTQGLVENIYTERPIPSETDYSKADKTDRKINQTYFLVDKQNQTIQSVITNTTDTSNPNSIASKQSVLTQRVDTLESEIQNVAGMVMTKDSMTGTITFTDETNTSEPITLEVYPTSQNISYLYPREDLYPSDTLYMTDRIIRFHNNTTGENFDYTLPDDLLYYDSEHYDKFRMDLNSETCEVIKKCKYNADGTVSLLANERTNSYTYEHFEITEGTYTVSIYGYNSGYLSVTLMAKNIYTDQFYTKVETDTKISQTERSIDLSVNQKLSNYSTTQEMNSAITLKANEINSVVSTKVGNNEIISKINQSAEQVSINANKVNISGVITAINSNTNTTINGNKITTGSITASQVSSDVITTTNFSAQNINASKITSGTLNVDRISANSISANKIVDNSITATKIANSTITGTKIANATITDTNIASLNADKITAGTIATARLSSDVITTSNLSAQTISANQITSGTLSANRISGGTINGNNVTITNLNASNIRSGRLNITSGNYYLRMGFSEGANPSVSGLNVGSYGIKANSGITATSFAITNSDTGKSVSFQVPRQGGGWYYITFTGGILTAWERRD